MTAQSGDLFTERMRELIFRDPEQLYRGSKTSASQKIREECAQIFFAAGKYVYETMGDLRTTLYYLERSVDLVLNPSYANERAQILDQVIQETKRLKTPWDTPGAVATYDDVQEQKRHANLDYEQYFRITRRGSYREAIAKGIRSIYQPGYSILEAGCAAGGYYYTLSKLLGHINYVGFDLSPKMVERAHRHFPDTPFFQGNALGIPFVDNQFDLVLATDVVNFVTDWQTAFSDLYRVARRFLVLRLRTLIDDSIPTPILTVGNRYLKYPYVLFNVNELSGFINALSPKPVGMKILLFVPEASSTLDAIDLAQYELPALKYEDGAVSVNKLLDLIVVKPAVE